MDTPSIEERTARRSQLDQIAAELRDLESAGRDILARVGEAKGLLNAAEFDLLRDDLAVLEAADV